MLVPHTNTGVASSGSSSPASDDGATSSVDVGVAAEVALGVDIPGDGLRNLAFRRALDGVENPPSEELG